MRTQATVNFKKNKNKMKKNNRIIVFIINVLWGFECAKYTVE